MTEAHPSIVSVHQPEVGFRPSGDADRELEWYFTMAESDIGLRSNFAATIGQAAPDTAESRAEALHAYLHVKRLLETVGEPDAGVLKAAYRAAPWKAELREALGRSTGVVVRLVAAAEGELPDDDGERMHLEVRTADALSAVYAARGLAGLCAHRHTAEALLKRAFRAYVRARGGKHAEIAWEGI